MIKKNNIFLNYIFSLGVILTLNLPSLAMAETSGAHHANIAEEEISEWESNEHIENTDILGSNTVKQTQDIFSKHLTDGSYQPLTTANIRIAQKEIQNKLKTATSEGEKKNLKADLKVLKDADNQLPVRTWTDRAYWMNVPHFILYGEAKKRPKNTSLYNGKTSRASFKQQKQKHYLQNNKNKLFITNITKSMDALND